MSSFARPIQSTEQPSAALFDWEHLDNQTMGDPALAQEVLKLFVTQVQGLADMLDRSTPDERRFLAHGLRGSASGVGALLLAQAAKVVETEPASPSALTQLRLLIGETLTEITFGDHALRGS